MTYEIKIEGMSCGHCVMAVKRELSKLPGIEKLDVQIGTATLDAEEGAVTREQLAAAIEEAGYTPAF